MAQVAIAAVKFMVGAIVSIPGAKEDTEKLIEDMAHDIGVTEQELADERQLAALQGKQGVEAYQQRVTTANERLALQSGQARDAYTAQLAENLQTQGENRRRTNVQAVNTQTQGRLAAGELEAGLAGSGVRRTGTAASLVGESTRLYNLNVGEIDRTLAGQEEAYAGQRSQLSLSREQAIEGYEFTRETDVESAGLALEQGVEGILGRDVALEDILSGDIDYADTLLTGALETDLAWLQKQEDEFDFAKHAGGLVLESALSWL